MIKGDVLAQILTRLNQFTAATLDGRTGDYVHVAEFDIDTSATYRLAVNRWTAINQGEYLGTFEVQFDDVDGLELMGIIKEHLAATYP